MKKTLQYLLLPIAFLFASTAMADETEGNCLKWTLVGDSNTAAFVTWNNETIARSPGDSFKNCNGSDDSTVGVDAVVTSHNRGIGLCKLNLDFTNKSATPEYIEENPDDASIQCSGYFVGNTYHLKIKVN